MIFQKLGFIHVLITYDMLEASDSTDRCVTCYVSYIEGLNSDRK